MEINAINNSLSAQSLNNTREDITRALEKMREMANQQETKNSSEVKSVEQNNFASILSQASNSINAVNNLQNESSQLKAAYASGDKSINLSEVVLASQKSSLAFQALLQVRNKMVDAYRDVMSMPM